MREAGPSPSASRRQQIAQLIDRMLDHGASRSEIVRAIAVAHRVNMRVAHRLMLGLTQQAVADLYNAQWPHTPPRTAKYIGYWENWNGPGSPPSSGSREPSVRDLLRLAELYGCGIDDLLASPVQADDGAVAPDGHQTNDNLPYVVHRDLDGGSPTNRRQALRAALLGITVPMVDWGGPAYADHRPRRVTPDVVNAVAATVAHAQRLDDSHGGGAALDYVADQHQALARLLRRGHYDEATGSALLSLLAQLAQTAGFMAYDARDDHTARRWYQAGLDAAHHADDPTLASSILGLLSNQSVSCGRTTEALDLAEASRRAAADGAPIVQALAAARGNLAAAAAGNHLQFQRTLDDVADHLGQLATQPTPAWAYYVSPVELDAINGRGLVMLTLREPRLQRKLLPDAEDKLRARALTHEPAYGRSGLRHAAWLALAYTHTGHIDQAIDAGRKALALLPTVNSARSRTLLHRLRTDLTHHQPDHPRARELISELDTRLTEPT